MNQYNMQEMIQGGAFGGSGPMQQSSFNPYQSNIIPFGGYGVYNQPNIQYYNPVQQNNGFVFQPVNGYQQSPYGYQQPQQNYYNPYGNTFTNQSPYGQNGYSHYGSSYNGYNGYMPFNTPMAMATYQTQQIELFKTKYRIANHYVGNDIDEEYLDKICNPNNPANAINQEQAQRNDEVKFLQYVSRVASGIEQVPESQAQRDARILNLMSYNLHKELDHHSLCEFFEEDLWRLQREDWIRKNVKINGTRDLSSAYNSQAYNQLLKLHNGSSNQYINEILNDSRYDNNLDDVEIGMNIAFEKERRRKAILEGKVPSFISSDEVQKGRHEWTKSLLDQMYRKGCGINV